MAKAYIVYNAKNNTPFMCLMVNDRSQADTFLDVQAATAADAGFPELAKENAKYYADNNLIKEIDETTEDTNLQLAFLHLVSKNSFMDLRGKSFDVV